MKRKKVLIFGFILIILLLEMGVVVNAEGSDDALLWEGLWPDITMFDEFEFEFGEFENENGGLGIIIYLIFAIAVAAFFGFIILILIFKMGTFIGIIMSLLASLYLLQLFSRDAGLLGLIGAIIGVSLALVGYLKLRIGLEDENENEIKKNNTQDTPKNIKIPPNLYDKLKESKDKQGLTWIEYLSQLL